MKNLFVLIFLWFFTNFSLFSCDQERCPYSVESLKELIQSLSTYNETDLCLRNETCAGIWMASANKVIRQLYERATCLQYQYETNITKENTKLLLDNYPLVSKLNKVLFLNGKQFYKYSLNWTADLRRQFFLTRMVYVPDENAFQLINLMTGIYALGKVLKDNRTYNLEPELNSIMANSRDYDQLLWAWKGWHDNVGSKMRNLFAKSVEFANSYTFREFGNKDLSEQWIQELETPDFEKVYDNLFEQIKPLYQQLHAYVRRKLREFYGKEKLNTKYIPAHLLGNMWAQDWSSLYSLVAPFKNVTLFNITETLIKKNYTSLKMFKDAERFFLSLNLFPMTDRFWNKSMLTKPTDGRAVQCHGAAYNFFNGHDYRIKMCTEVTDAYYYIVHHEMGHVEYFMSYSNLPPILSNGANSAFHEAIGDTISLSVNTPTHLMKVGLLESFDHTQKELEINFLMKIALKQISFLPYGYLIDKWRWQVYRGKIKPENYNKMWWKMIKEYQGIEPAMERDEKYFDAGAKFHVPAFVPYARYFVAHFLQFQFYKTMCQFANHTGPLYLCDFYGSKTAGLKFKEMMASGTSKEWQSILKDFTSSDAIDPSGILEYFKPLMTWLVNENAKYPNETVSF